MLKIDTCHIKRTFYKACNGILSHCSTADVFVKLSLVKAYCLPVLTYCIGALNLPVAKIKDLGVCWNDSFHKLFGYKRFESVKVVQYFVVNYRLISFMSYSDRPTYIHKNFIKMMTKRIKLTITEKQ